MLISQILAAHFLGNSFANVILQVGFGRPRVQLGRALAGDGTRKLLPPVPCGFGVVLFSLFK